MEDLQAAGTDLALTDPKKDDFGVAPLAKRLSENIVGSWPQDGWVIGLYGAWGSGKTTFINFVKHYINQYPEDERPIIINFNPWLFSDHTDLIQRYLIELSQALNPKKAAAKNFIEKYFGKADFIIDASCEILKFAANIKGVPLVEDSVDKVGSLSKRMVERISEQPSLSEQKDKIQSLLKKNTKKIFVVIDDIDRLEVNEILDVFRLGKSVANFANITYLLSFDKKLVSNIVSQLQMADGDRYLEKIIQYEVELPYPGPEALLKLFSKKVDPILAFKGGKEWSKERWSKFYRDYFRFKLMTPRHIIRIANSIRFSYPTLRGEVNPVDFIAIEALRMFNPEIYHEVRRNKPRMTETGGNDFRAEKEDPVYFRGLIDRSHEDQRQSVQGLLELLFPRIEARLRNSKPSSSDISEWRSDARVCSEYHFDRYFSLVLDDNLFSDAELSEVIESSSNQDFLKKKIEYYKGQVKANGISRIPEFLERLNDLIQAGRADVYTKDILKALLIDGDIAVREEDEDMDSFFRIDSDMRILWILGSAIKRITDQSELFDTLKEGYEHSQSVMVPIRLLFYLGREHGLYGYKEQSIRPGQPPYLTQEQITQLEPLMMSILCKSATNDRLLNSPSLLHTLYRWRDIKGSFDEPKAWVESQIPDDTKFRKLIEAFTNITTTSSGEKTTHTVNIKLKDLRNFMDSSAAEVRVKAFLADGSNTPKEKEAFEALLRACDNERKGIKEDRWEAE